MLCISDAVLNFQRFTPFSTFPELHALCTPGRNAEAQEKLHADVTSVIGGKPDAYRPTRADIEAMPYLDAALKESMRLAPVALGIARDMKEDLDIGGKRCATAGKYEVGRQYAVYPI